MTKTISVRLDKSRQEKLAFLYKLHEVKSNSISKRFIELLDKLYSEKTEQSNTPTLSTNQHPDLELLKDWDCVYRVLIYPYDRISKKKEPKVFCLNPTTREILKTNELYIPICKKCHDTKGSIKPPELPEPKKPLEKEKAEFLERSRKQRKCADCGCDISSLDDWKTLCYSCWNKKQNPAPKQSETKPLGGSPAALRKKEADAIRRVHERIN